MNEFFIKFSIHTVGKNSSYTSNEKIFAEDEEQARSKMKKKFEDHDTYIIFEQIRKISD